MTLLPLVTQIDIHVEHFGVFPLLTDEIDDPEFLEFAIENHSELFGYIAQGNLNIRIHRIHRDIR